jgi:FkbM family methyltransferase
MSDQFTNLVEENVVDNLEELVRECWASYPLPVPDRGQTWPIAVDIGANIGAFSIYANAFFHKIYAFEPFGRHCQLTRKFCELMSIDNVEVFQKAVTGQSGAKVQLRAEKESYSGNITCADFESEDFSSLDASCETVSLNDIFGLIKADRINYLKIDCEGSEYEIFKNFDSYDKIDFIAIELHDFYGFECKRELLERIHRTHYIIDFKSVEDGFETLSPSAKSELIKRLDVRADEELARVASLPDEVVRAHNLWFIRHNWWPSKQMEKNVT